MATRTSPQARQAEREIVVTLRLPRELHARLKELGGERGLTAEVRRRLEASFRTEQSAPDATTAKLLDDIGQSARTIQGWHGLWHESPWSLAAMRGAVVALLASAGPKGDPVFEARPDSLADVLFSDDERKQPETLGKMLATTVVAEGKR